MKTLIIVAHPDTTSLTHHAARRLQQALSTGAAEGGGVAEFVDLAAKAFDPRFSSADRAAYLGHGHVEPSVFAEQQRVDRAQHLVLIFPLYWWSLPAMLKGWIDRVFVAGWAFEEEQDGRIVGRLQRLTVHLLPLSGTSAASLNQHGYASAFSTQIEAGIIDFCGASRGRTVFVYDSETGDGRALATVETAIQQISSSIAASAGIRG